MGTRIITAICTVLTMGFCSPAFAQSNILSTLPGGGTTGSGPSANPARPIQDLPPEQKADQQLMNLDARVNLTEDQKIQLRQAFSTLNNEQEMTKSYNETDPVKTSQANQQLNLQRQEAINKILTPEQRATLNSNWGTGLP